MKRATGDIKNIQT